MKLDELEAFLTVLRKHGVTKYSGTPDGFTAMSVELGPTTEEAKKAEEKRPRKLGADGLTAEMQRLAYGGTLDAVEE